MRLKKSAVFFCMAAIMVMAVTAVGNREVKADSVSETNDGMILIEGGTFTMGSPKKERLRGQDEVSHKVTVSSFYVDPYEVTQKDYQEVMGKNPSKHKGAVNLLTM